MRRRSVLFTIGKLGKRIFTTREIAMVSGKSSSAVTQALNNLAREGIVDKIYRGVWTRENDEAISPFAVMPHLFPGHRVYVSFISALHLHGIIEQIPQITTLAATFHARKISTKIGVFQAYHITPSFFAGFGWYKDNGNFLVAEPEKAFVDCLYLSAHKGRRFGHFPELHFPASFSFKRAIAWADKIHGKTARLHVKKMIAAIRSTCSRRSCKSGIFP